MINIVTRDIVFSLVSSSDRFPVDFDEAWQWLGYSRKADAKRALLNAGFIENEDLRITPEPITTGIQAHPNENIRLTVDCLKMWSMMSGTAQGKQVRLYFLECEKIAKQKQESLPALPKTFAEALQLAADQAKQIELQAKQLEAAKPAIEFAEAIAVSDESIDFNQFAKIVGTGRTRLFRMMRDRGVILQQSNLPYQKWIDAGYFEATEIVGPNGVNVYALVTGKGQLWLQQKLAPYFSRREEEQAQLDLLDIDYRQYQGGVDGVLHRN